MSYARSAAIVLPVALATALVSAPALADDQNTIAAVQLPAWVERSGHVIAVRPGFALEAGDTLLTGAHGRVHVDTADGSMVKLGSGGKLAFEQLAVKQDATGSFFQSALNVLKGAFRFTTQLAGASKRRDVRVRIGVVTAGVRGTDIWGKSDDQKDLICLLEGKIAVASDGAPEQEMAGSDTFYVVPHGKAPNPIGPVPPEKIANEWAPQTELAPDGAALSADGKIAVVLLSRTSADAAQFFADRLNGQGYPAEVAPLADGTARVLVRGFATADDAKRFMQQIDGVSGIHKAFIAKG